MGNSQSSEAATGDRRDSRLSNYARQSCVAPSRQSREEKAIVGSGEPLSLELIMKVSRSVCKITVNSATGSGFLGKMLQRATGQYCYGLFTNNHVLNEDTLAGENSIVLSFDALDGERVNKRTVNIDVTPLFRFTCPVLDVSYAELSREIVGSLQSIKCNFLLVSTAWIGTNGEKLLMLQYPGGSNIQFAQGSFKRMHGFDIFHLVSTDYGSSGSPLVRPDGVVVGIHKRRAARDTDNYNVALSTTAAVQAMTTHSVEGQFLKATLICNPTILEGQYDASIKQIGLQKCPQWNKFKGLIYVSPATIIKGTVTVTPIWFTPTSHGWYWTPTDPFNVLLETNWMSVNVLQVEGGYWHMQIPAQKNITIITWLCNHNRIK